MAYGLVEQLEPDFARKQWLWDPNKPWRMRRRSAWRRDKKVQKARVERRRAKYDPECVSRYGRYCGWEY